MANEANVIKALEQMHFDKILLLGRRSEGLRSPVSDNAKKGLLGVEENDTYRVWKAAQDKRAKTPLKMPQSKETKNDIAKINRLIKRIELCDRLILENESEKFKDEIETTDQMLFLLQSGDANLEAVKKERATQLYYFEETSQPEDVAALKASTAALDEAIQSLEALIAPQASAAFKKKFEESIGHERDAHEDEENKENRSNNQDAGFKI